MNFVLNSFYEYRRHWRKDPVKTFCVTACIIGAIWWRLDAEAESRARCERMTGEDQFWCEQELEREHEFNAG